MIGEDKPQAPKQVLNRPVTSSFTNTLWGTLQSIVNDWSLSKNRSKETQKKLIPCGVYGYSISHTSNSQALRLAYTVFTRHAEFRVVCFPGRISSMLFMRRANRKVFGNSKTYRPFNNHCIRQPEPREPLNDPVD